MRLLFHWRVSVESTQTGQCDTYSIGLPTPLERQKQAHNTREKKHGTGKIDLSQLLRGWELGLLVVGYFKEEENCGDG